MAAPTLHEPATKQDQDPVSVVRARAVSHAKQLRALACVALRDGAPRAALRAANARAAARSVLAHARALSHLGMVEHAVG